MESDSEGKEPMVKINELRISSSGSSDDTSNFIELVGTPGQSLDGHALLVISGEFEPGQIDFAFDLTGGALDSDGIFLLSNPGEYANDAGDITADFDFFGSPITVMLVDGFTGNAGNDLDTDNDGALDATPWTTIVDSVSLVDGDGTTDRNYSSVVTGPASNGSNAPSGLARVPDETGDFVQLEFSDRSADTPGTLNVRPDLQITEMFPGNEPGNNLTSDWIEITNTGTAAWEQSAHGALWYDDDSQDPTAADPITGITTIAPGESVVVVLGDAADVTEFETVWGEVADLSGVQIGMADGSGLGQGGDGATLFVDADMSGGVTGSEIADFEDYPDANADGGESYDVARGGFSGDLSDPAILTTAALNDADQPAVASPGEAPAATAVAAWTLELLHAADQEAGSAAIIDAPNFSAVLNALRAEDIGGDGEPDNTITLSAGDAFIPGIFYDTSDAVFGASGVADIQIQNELGFQAIALGNHEFDFNTRALSELITGQDITDDSDDDFTDTVPQSIANFGDLGGTSLDNQDFGGAAFPYLSTNLDFSTDSFLAPLETASGQAPQAGVVSGSTVLDVNGEKVGVVGATTPTLAAISSPGGVGIQPTWAGTTPTSAELDALAAEIQNEVDALLGANPGMNKVVLLAHMQQLEIEQGLATRLENVDIIVGGGSNTRLIDDNDRLRDGDSDQGDYPQFFTNAGGTDTVLVNTDGSYKYVGRLVIDFDADGNILRDSYDANVSGAFATDAQGVADLGAEGLVDPEIQAIVDAIEAEIIATEGNVLGYSEVFLNGNRSGTGAADDGDGVRTQETNLGNLTADANLAAAQAIDGSVVVSIKNGGGIRASIGETVVPAGGTEAVRTSNSELVDGDGNVIKPEGGISQTDIQTTLAFNNGLTLLTLTREELVDVLEHGVGALPGVSGRFPQVSGVEFSFDDTQPEGSRIVDAAIVDDDGAVIAELVSGGALVGAPTEEFRIVTLDFLARSRFDDDGNFTGAGDGYPFPNFNADPTEGEVADAATLARINAVALEQENVQTGNATFADDGTEQDALAEYLNANHGTPETAFSGEDMGAGADQRIENINAPDLDDSFLDENTADLRVATFNASLNRSGEGDLIADLSSGDNGQAQSVAEIIQKADADIILINEFDYDAAGEAADLFRTNYLEVGQNGEDPVEYPYVYVASSNTGVASGFDLDNNGSVGGAGDAQGFGFFEGQFGFVIFSKHEIDMDGVRTFQNFLWKDMPGARLPADPQDADGNGDSASWYTAEELEVLRLSSKNHVDVPVVVDGEVVHVLAAHPTPPVFDGPEDRNGLRNADEIRFWADYVNGTDGAYIYDDAGQMGGLAAGERFVIVGDYNADPFDGDSVPGAAQQLLNNDAIIGSATDASITPTATGGVEAAQTQGGANDSHTGDPSFDTADFGFAGVGNPDGTPGNIRVDYALPSVSGFEYVDGQIFWPDYATFPDDAALADFPTSDHRLVAVDLNLTEKSAAAPEATGEIKLERIGVFDSGVGEGGSEVVAFAADSARMFTTNGEEDRIDVADLSDPTAPVLLGSIDLSGVDPLYDGLQSVAVNGTMGAAAVSRESADGEPLRGLVVMFDTQTLEITGQVQVGYLPDMVTFTPDGAKILVANEGEPGDAGDVPGSVSIIDTATMGVSHAGFEGFDAMAAELKAAGVRLFPETELVTDTSAFGPMAQGEGGYTTASVLTIGETITGTSGALNATTAGDYTPVGVIDGLGAFELDASTVRVMGNHELLHFRGNEYEVSDGAGGTFTMIGARISYFDIDKQTKQIVDAGIAYDTIYDANGDVATDLTFLPETFAPAFGTAADSSQWQGFSRFCSGMLVEPTQFGPGRGIESTIYFAGEEDGGNFNNVGGAEWALDVATGEIWQVPAMGRGAWENITEIDTGTTDKVAFILADDSSPFDADGDGEDEAAPLFLYVGEKDPDGNFLEQNGLSGGDLYVWVADSGALTPLEFRGTGATEGGQWVAVDNAQDVGMASEDGTTGYDEYGYPTQRNLWTQAEALGAFGFSRPEDVATNPADGTEIVLASTGVDTFAVDPASGDGADSFGTIYTIKTEFTVAGTPVASQVRIAYDGDSDPTRALRSPDNLDWADDGFIYVQEDQAEFDTLNGEPLFNGGVNPNEASILRLDATTGEITRVAEIDRSVIHDPTTTGTAFDTDAGFAGAWESSGILDVSSLFGEAPGTLHLFSVQAHGIEDQTGTNTDSRINDGDLVEGGQLLFLQQAIKAPSLDLEPEYITVAPDGQTAFVALQEANAVAVLDIASGEFTKILPLGTTDHSVAGFGLDASDRDDAINIQNWPLFGMHMPDAIASFEVDGQTYFVTANEGDARDSAGVEERVKDVVLDPTAFPDAAALQADEAIGRINVSTSDGDLDGDGDQDALFSYGSRSFTIFDAEGNKVFDSGSAFERIIADVRVANAFNNDDFPTGDAEVIDENRSDNKGPEPEAITVGTIGDQVYAFIGLERDSGIVVYNVTDPANAEYVQYINSVEDGDISPEVLTFVSAEDSPSGQPLLLAANEVSGTTAVYQIDVAPTPNALPNGVQSGDVTEDSAVLLARSLNPGTMTFEVFDDTGASVTVLTAEVTDVSVPVKVKAEGLDAGADYTYTVTDADGASHSGRFVTAAEDGYHGLSFGVTGDWRGEIAPYTAISNVPDMALDFMVLLGDTIYADYPTDAVPQHAQSLADYRAKFAEVYGETLGENFFADLFRSTSIFATIDDHEVTNDFAGGATIGAAAESEFRDFFPGDDPAALVNDSTLYENGIQAFQEFHAIDAQTYGATGDPVTENETKLYRSQEYGQDAAVFILDQRSFRDEQIAAPTDLTNPAEVGAFLAGSFDPTRTLLGEAQLTELLDDLLAAEQNGVTWKFVHTPEPFQNLGLANPDSWEGYQYERALILDFIDDNDIDNVVFVAADIHATFVNNITYARTPGGEQIATSAFEITTGSVAFDQPFGPTVVEVAAASGLLTPDQVAFYDSLPLAPDGDGIPNDKDDFVAAAFNDITLTPQGLDRLGLDDNLPQAEGLIDAELVQGGWVSAHTYGWTQFDIDEATQQLTVTTWGVPGYGEDELSDDPDAVLDTEPMIVSQFTVNAQPDFVSIFNVQGAGHRSAHEGEVIGIQGIVTAIDEGEGFWVQDPDGDGDMATSDGIYVDGAATVAVGDMVRVTGEVVERQFGNDLSTTTLDNWTEVTVMSSGNALPDAVVLGASGLLPPTGVIDDDGLTSFDPTTDGIDFFESLEGMRISLEDGARVIGSNRFGETFVSVHPAGDGETVNGGLLLGGANGVITDPNPERILIDDDIYADSGRGAAQEDVPAATAGDTVTDVTGVLDYSFGEFKLLAETAPIVVPGSVTPEVTDLDGDAEGALTIASYNVLNLDPGDDAAKFEKLAQDIVTGLASPDIIGLQEIQDNDGSDDTGTVAADATYQALIDAIVAAGGPSYEFADSTPLDKTDGGQPGANIRVGFLYNPAAVTLTGTLRIEGTLDPNGAFDEDPVPGDGVNDGFAGTRKPLVGTFMVGDEEVTVIVTHFKSKSGDTPLSGSVQPPVEVTQVQRIAQAEVVNAYVAGLLAADANAKIAVVGDMNDFQFSNALAALAGDELVNLVDGMAQEDAYSFNFNGNSQMLDHILVSQALAAASAELDAVHINADFPSDSVASDHDPLVARFDLDADIPIFAADIPIFAADEGDHLLGTDGAEVFMVGAGDDAVVLQGGADTVEGGAGDFDGDILIGFGADDKFVFTGSRLSGGDVSHDEEAGTMRIGGETMSLFESETEGGAFMVTRSGDQSTVQYVGTRVEVSEGRSVDAADVNGIDPDAFLTGQNGQSYGVELDVAGAGFSNALGWFTRDETGAISDVEMLFENAKSAGTGAMATIAGVDADEELGFFLVQNGASLVLGLTGTLGLAEQGGELVLTEDGAALDAIVFNSLDSDLNRDGLEHVLSGATDDGLGLRVGFEDMLGGGDRDYQDVTFTVTVLDDTLL